jgi:LacI family transcriptional regulator
MANIQDVADAAGVSTASVSRYLSGQTVRTAEAIRAAIEALDYTPSTIARSLKTGRHNAIGVVVPDITNPFFAGLVRGIEDEARVNGYDVILGNSDESPTQEEALVQALITRVDGLIVAPIIEEDQSILALSKTTVPVVLVDRSVTSATNYDSVLVDNIGGIALAVEHLVKLGHTRIGFISGPLSSTPGRARHTGYVVAAAAQKLDHFPELVIEGDFREESGAAAMRQLWNLAERPTAVIVANNLMTIGALKALRALRVEVPTEMSIIVFDDLSFAELLQPPLTVIARGDNDQGARAATLLIQRIEGTRTRAGEATTLPVELIVRGSTAPPQEASTAASNPAPTKVTSS